MRKCPSLGSGQYKVGGGVAEGIRQQVADAESLVSGIHMAPLVVRGKNSIPCMFGYVSNICLGRSCFQVFVSDSQDKHESNPACSVDNIF